MENVQVRDAIDVFIGLLDKTMPTMRRIKSTWENRGYDITTFPLVIIEDMLKDQYELRDTYMSIETIMPSVLAELNALDFTVVDTKTKLQIISFAHDLPMRKQLNGTYIDLLQKELSRRG